MSRKYKVTDPNGKEYIFTGAFVKNLEKIGAKNSSWMRQVAQGKRDNCNGWICEYIK